MSTTSPIGVYSARAAELYGTSLFEDAEGKTVEASAVYSSVEEAMEHYRWDDKVIVSTTIVRWRCKGRRGSSRMDEEIERFRELMPWA